MGRAAAYCTFSIKVTVCVSPPAAAVTVTVDMPIGVPGSGGGGGGPLLPPPQPAIVTRDAKTIKDSSVPQRRRRFAETPSRKTPARVIPPVAHQPNPLRAALCGAVV